MNALLNRLFNFSNRLQRCLVLIMIAGFLIPLQPVQAETEKTYSFGVIPHFGQQKIFTIWTPVITELSRRTGLKFNLVIPRTISEFEESLEKGEFDFVYANPYHILRVSHSQGYIPLVRDKTPLRGILVVRSDSPVKSVKELSGKSLAVPSPNALGASLLLRADLERLYGVHMSMVNESTHNAVYLSVIHNITDAGGGVKKSLAEQDKNIQNQLRILYTTRAMPSHPIAANPRINPGVQSLVKNALLDMGKNKAGKLLLSEIPMESPVSASLNDYLKMRNWGLDHYWVTDPAP
jgi:phosphonate transport system substrate-binding protein